MKMAIAFLRSMKKPKCVLVGIWMTFLLLFIDKGDAASNNRTSTRPTTIYQVSASQIPPPECVHWLRPLYHTEVQSSAYQLLIDVSGISPKNFQVDVDYEKGLIDVLGWIQQSPAISSSAVGEKKNNNNNENAKHTCVYQQWNICSIPDSRFDVHDLVMERKDGKLVISIPFSKIEARNEGHPADERKEKNKRATITTTDSPPLHNHDDSLRIRALLRVSSNKGQKIIGLARIAQNSTQYNSNSMMLRGGGRDDDFQNNKRHSRHSHSDNRIISPKSKQKEALERFIAVSLTNTEEEAYWLHKM